MKTKILAVIFLVIFTALLIADNYLVIIIPSKDPYAVDTPVPVPTIIPWDPSGNKLPTDGGTSVSE